MPDISLRAPVAPMWDKHGQTVGTFGKDNTGTVVYSFNNQGFRNCSDFESVPNYAFFGCSIVFGVGVDQDKTFAGKFSNAQNYGVCGDYNNEHIFQTIENFLNSALYTPEVKMAVVWTDRDTKLLDQYYQQLAPYKFVHVFCGQPLPYPNCYPMIANMDWDVSKTHPGEKTHQFLYKFLCRAFDR